MPAQPEGIPWPQEGALTPPPGGSLAPFATYIHVPFCTVRCGYCDFNTYTKGFGAGADLATYADSVIAEIEFSKRTLDRAGWPVRPVESIFFGGGTPSLMEPAAIGKILDALDHSIGIGDNAEVTLEANPENLNDQRAKEFQKWGINRFSIGMQSAVPRVLSVLDRIHNPENVPKAVAAAKNAGCQVSVDLIYGAPGESTADWETSLQAAIGMEPDHISAYSLIIEEGTKMGRDLKAGLIPPSDPDEDAQKYEMADQLLGEAGYNWYEISNFSRSPETRSTHNLAYWRDWDWWGYGPGAHSHLAGQRWWNVKHPLAYAGKLTQGHSPAYAGEQLDDEDRRVEKVMLGIRTSDGLPTARLDPLALARLQTENLLVVDAMQHAVLTLSGRLLADYVTRVLLGWE